MALPGPARRLPLLAALALAGCGGPSTPAFVTTQPCLRESGTLIDHGRPPALPFLSPYNPDLGRMPAPAPFRRDLEISFTVPDRGANDLRLFFFFSDAEAATRSYERIRKHSLRRYRFLRRREIAYVRGTVLELRGPVLLLWSSAPTPRQMAALGRCLD